MTYSYGITLLILCPLVFLAAFIDAIAGGGGLISVPAYIFAGLPIHIAYGTNKFSASMGTATASVNYFRGGCVDNKAAIAGCLGALAGSWVGTRLALSLSPRALQISLMVLLPLVGIFIVSSRGVGNTRLKNQPGTKTKFVLSTLIGLVFGCYDGFFGPGTGMFMTLALSGLVRLDLIKAVGTTKLLNLSSNIASMVTWLINGKILFSLALPCTLCSIAGGFLGSRLTMKIGKKLIRIVLVLVAALLFIRIAADLFR